MVDRFGCTYPIGLVSERTANLLIKQCDRHGMAAFQTFKPPRVPIPVAVYQSVPGS